jgi:hypothetical protein
MPLTQEAPVLTSDAAKDVFIDRTTPFQSFFFFFQ